MALHTDAPGKQTHTLIHAYGWRDTVRYALGVGATAEYELDYLYEGRGPKVLPTFGEIPAFATFDELFNIVGGDMLGVVHGGETIRLHQSFAPEDELTTIGEVAGIYDLKRLAVGLFKTRTTDRNGALVCETESEIIFRNDGGFGGQKPPRKPKVILPDRAPDFVSHERTSNEQALLYRLSGDLNPLHADPEISKKAGFERPILHGLCTFGYVGRVVLRHACDGDTGRFAALSGQFRKPVWPGDTLVVHGWVQGEQVALRVTTEERPDEVCFSNAFADIRS